MANATQEKRGATRLPAEKPKEMKAVALDRFGGLEEMKLRTLPVPEVGPDEALIRVQAAGVGVWDPYEREGGFAEMTGTKPAFPYVPGSDGAGTVAAVGERVRRFKAGDRVYGFSLGNPKGGFYAEYAVLPEDMLSPVPAALTAEQAGALPVCAMTALRGLEALSLKPGESLLILGAGGGIGHLAVQLAKRMGARVLAVASGEDGVALARRLGADAAVEGGTEDLAAAGAKLAPGGFDAALLTTGGEAADRALAAVHFEGRAAYPNGVEPEPKARPGVPVRGYDGTPDREAMERLNRLIASGPFDVHVARAFSLAEAAEAQRALDTHFPGKLILRPD